MHNNLKTMEEVMARLCGENSLEQACDNVFHLLRTHMPLRFLLLGFFQKEKSQGFILSLTDQKGTRRFFRAYDFSEEQQRLAQKIHFFHDTPDVLVDSPSHPYAPLFRNADLTLDPPFFTTRFFHANIFQGAGTFGFEPGASVSAENLELLRILKMPFNIYITSQYRYWEFNRINKMVEEDNARLRKQVQGIEQPDFVGATGGLREVTATLQQVAPLDVSLLIQGETGTGKEVLAKAAHSLSQRRKGPFIAVNCGAIPPSLIDNELFGHSKGSYTGAGEVYRGRFERACGGTLFLDEVGELPLEVQARLLRVLEEKQIERLGGNQAIPVDFRLITATHRNLKNMAEEGSFRQDLYYRLAVVSLRLPPLRERKQDIPPLVRHFIEQCSLRFGIMPPELSLADMADLCAREWPGNIRQLRNTVEEAVALARSGRLIFRTEPPQGDSSSTLSSAPASPLPPYDSMMQSYLERALTLCHGKIQGPGSAAEMLHLNPNTLRAKLRKYGVSCGRSAKK